MTNPTVETYVRFAVLAAIVLSLTGSGCTPDDPAVDDDDTTDDDDSSYSADDDDTVSYDDLELLAQLDDWPALDVVVSGDLAYVAAADQGLRIVDIADPGAPVEIGAVALPEIAYEVALDGTRAFVPCWGSGLRVVDVSDPTAPAEVDDRAIEGYALTVAARDGVVYVGSWSGDYHGTSDPDHGVTIVDAQTLGVLAVFHTLGWAGDLALHGDRLLVADGPGGLFVIDVADPAQAWAVDIVATEVRAYGVAASDSLVFVADNAGGLRVIDAATFVEVGTLAMPGYAYAVAADDDRVWVGVDAGYGSGYVDVIDVTDPTAPVGMHELQTTSRIWGLAIDGDVAYAAAPEGGLLVLSNPTE